MPDIEILAVLGATAAAFLIGGAYYAAAGDALASASGAPADQDMPGWTLAVEAGRCLLIALVVAGLASQGGIDDLAGGLALGLALWIGFPVVLLVGAVMHEGARPRVATIHAGDWLLKLLAVGVLVSVMQ